MGGCYQSFLPFAVYYGITFRDLVKLDNIALQKKKFEKRGKFELETLKSVKHVLGRTEFDRAVVEMVYPDIQYHFCPENLRRDFLECDRKWRIDCCCRHSIFMSQGSYPIKGLHLAIQAINIVKKMYPDVTLYIAGSNNYKDTGFLGILKRSSYTCYILNLISKYNLEENIVFLGSLPASKMIDRYLEANVFILPSVMENSPNSLMEAMVLGVPSVASNVGGISTFISHAVNGYTYPADEYYMLAYYIMMLFSDDEKAQFISENALALREKVDVERNVLLLRNIYEDIYKMHI